MAHSFTQYPPQAGQVYEYKGQWHYARDCSTLPTNRLQPILYAAGSTRGTAWAHDATLILPAPAQLPSLDACRAAFHALPWKGGGVGGETGYFWLGGGGDADNPPQCVYEHSGKGLLHGRVHHGNADAVDRDLQKRRVISAWWSACVKQHVAKEVNNVDH